MTDIPTSERSIFSRRIAAMKRFFRTKGPQTLFGEAVPIPVVKTHAPEIALLEMSTQSLAKNLADSAELIAERNISTPEPAQTDLLYRVGDLIDGQFRVETVLSGGMGIVYVCREVVRFTLNTAGESITGTPEGDSNQRPRRAIKSFYRKYVGHADIARRFRQEALLWISLPPHPNIVRAWTFSSVPLLVLEYIDGGNLRAKMQAGLLKEDEVIRISIEFCNGMCFLQEAANIIHRDIKPENIMLTRSGITKITDFGLARALQSSRERETNAANTNGVKSNDSLTQQGVIVGTLPYMSPEQYVGFHGMSTASDVYSFGVVLYEMLTGRKPFLPPGSTIASGSLKRAFDMLPVELKVPDCGS